MSRASFNSDIISWLNFQPYWMQNAALKVMSNTDIQDEEINEIFDFYLEDNNLREKEKHRPAIDLSNCSVEVCCTLDNDFVLSEINNINGVNALADNQKIEFCNNMTVLFGNNGSGKTGYIRLLNNIFNSRGEKEILGNVYKKSGDHQEPSCKLIFKKAEEEKNISYPSEKEKLELKCYSVFDNVSVRTHLDKENELSFTPQGFEFFDGISNVFNKLQEKLTNEINANNLPNTYKIHFNNENEVKSIIDNLNYSTKISDLEKLADIKPEDFDRLNKIEIEKNSLQALNKDKQIAELVKIVELLNDFKTKFESFKIILNQENINVIKSDIKDFVDKKKISSESNSSRFHNLPIKNIGSDKWNSFIKASSEFAKTQKADYPKVDDTCLFCMQPLGEKEVELIGQYWKILSSTLEDDIKKIQKRLENYSIQANRIDTNLFVKDSILKNWLEENEKEIYKSWSDTLTELEKNKNELISNLKKQNWDEISVSKMILTEDIINLVKKIEENIQVLKVQDKTEEIKKLDNEINLIKDRIMLSKLLSDIKKYIEKSRWSNKASKLNNLNARAITAKQTEMYSKYITDNYREIFNSECKRLNANFGIEVNQRGQRGHTKRKLKLVGFEPRRVLSEGEQRAISLADFLTEIQIDNSNKGLIFDDPVTSLDHERKKIIAHRLAEESGARQIIIFTHDLMFLYYLNEAINELSLDIRCHWIEKRELTPGNIFLDNGPSYEREYKSTEKAKKFYEKAKDASPEEQEVLLKQGFGALRTNYEYFVIFNLFNSVVKRFEERVSIERLKEVVINDEIVQEVILKTGNVSRYIDAHLHSDGFAANKPTPKTLLDEIESFNKLVNKHKELKKLSKTR